MKEHEYRRMRQTLEEAMEEALEQVRLGYRAQMRALDMVWMASPENPTPVFELVEGWGLPERRGIEAGRAPLALAPAPLPPEPPEPPAKQRWPRGELRRRILELLPQLTGEFTREDLEERISGAPDRSSLYRILNDLTWDGEIEIVEQGYQHVLTRFRWKGTVAVDAAEE